MSDRPSITLTFQSADLSDDRLQADIEKLLPQLRQIDGLTAVEPVPIAEAPPNSKAIGGVVLGTVKFLVDNSKILQGLVGLTNILFSNGKTFELSVKTANGQEIAGKAKNLAELEQVIQLGEATIKRLEQG